MQIDCKDALDKFNRQRHQAKRRGKEFLLSFDEWLDIWDQSGHWQDRGKGKGKYNMSRYNDQGPYAVGNVFIQSHEGNASDGHKGIPKTPEQKLKSGLGRKLAWQRFREMAL
jgi:hypothetical protein